MRIVHYIILAGFLLGLNACYCGMPTFHSRSDVYQGEKDGFLCTIYKRKIHGPRLRLKMILRLDHLETKHYGIYQLEGGCVLQGIACRIEPHIGHSFARYFPLVSLGCRSMYIDFEYSDEFNKRLYDVFLRHSYIMT